MIIFFHLQYPTCQHDAVSRHDTVKCIKSYFDSCFGDVCSKPILAYSINNAVFEECIARNLLVLRRFDFYFYFHRNISVKGLL